MTSGSTTHGPSSVKPPIARSGDAMSMAASFRLLSFARCEAIARLRDIGDRGTVADGARTGGRRGSLPTRAAAAPRRCALPVVQVEGELVLVPRRGPGRIHADEVGPAGVTRGGVPRRLRELVRTPVLPGRIHRGVAAGGVALVRARAHEERVVADGHERRARGAERDEQAAGREDTGALLRE